MRRIAHIVNPVLVAETSDLFRAQPITFETIRVAKEFAFSEVVVELYSAQYPEDHPVVPEWIACTPDLDRSILNYGSFSGQRKLPLIRDILDRLYHATSAEYLIYTNVDIALMPAFYLAVNQLIDRGYDAFVINRRTIPNLYSSITEIPLMYGEVGQPHPGHDCFVFHRDACPSFVLGNTCIGANWVGRLLICNLACHGHRFREFSESHLSFHIGDDRAWLQRSHSPYNDYNVQQVLVCLDRVEATYGPFSKHDAVYHYIKEFREYVAQGDYHILPEATSAESFHLLRTKAREARQFAMKLLSSRNNGI